MSRKLVLLVTWIELLLATSLISKAFYQQVDVSSNESQALEYFFLRDRNFTNTHIPSWGNWTWNMSSNFEGYSRYLPNGGADLYYNESGGKGWGGAIFLQGTHPHTGFRDFILGGADRQSAVLKEFVSFSRTDEIAENEFILSAKIMVNERNFTEFGNQREAVSNVGVDLMFGYDNANYSDPDWNHRVAIHADVIVDRTYWFNNTKTEHHNEPPETHDSGSNYGEDYHLTLIRGKMENIGTWYEFNIDLREVIETIFNLTKVNTLHFRGVQVYVDGISSYTKAAFSYVYTHLRSEKFTPVFQKGMSYATYANLTPDAYGSAESDESLRRMKQMGVEWVAINVVGWYQTNNQSADIERNSSQAPTDDALAHVIQTAHSLKMKVMLKPMIDLEDGRWRGEIQPSKKWFENYTSYINFFAEFAEQYGVEMLCVGTELNRTVSWETEWRSVISGVHQRYPGLLTYAAIWYEEYDKRVKWWDVLDYVGINAYFPLSDVNDPTITKIKSTWENITMILDTFYSEWRKPIIFTEIGYLSTDGTNMNPSNYTLQNVPGRQIDLQEQELCYEFAFQALWRKSWFYGFIGGIGKQIPT